MADRDRSIAILIAEHACLEIWKQFTAHHILESDSWELTLKEMIRGVFNGHQSQSIEIHVTVAQICCRVSRGVRFFDEANERNRIRAKISDFDETIQLLRRLQEDDGVRDSAAIEIALQEAHVQRALAELHKNGPKAAESYAKSHVTTKRIVDLLRDKRRLESYVNRHNYEKFSNKIVNALTPIADSFSESTLVRFYESQMEGITLRELLELDRDEENSALPSNPTPRKSTAPKLRATSKRIVDNVPDPLDDVNVSLSRSTKKKKKRSQLVEDNESLSEDDEDDAATFSKKRKVRPQDEDYDDDDDDDNDDDDDAVKLSKKRKFPKSPLYKHRNDSESRPIKSPKQKRVAWTSEEVEYLKKGVAKYGEGNWTNILKAYAFLSCRTSVSLKDKWRNLLKYDHMD